MPLRRQKGLQFDGLLGERVLPAVDVPAYGELIDTPVRVVAVLGTLGVDDWGAYVGLARASAAEVAAMGIKLPADEAAALFPYLNRERYRR